METAEIAKIAVSAAPYSIDKPYDYLIPPEFAETAVPGVRVSVPFGRGNRSSEGIILSRVTGEKSPRLKAIGQVLDAEPMLSGADIALALWMRQRYFCTFFEAARTILPAGLWYGFREVWHLTPGLTREEADERTGRRKKIPAVLDVLFAHGGSAEIAQLREACGEEVDKTLNLLRKLDMVYCETSGKRKVGDKLRYVAELTVEAEDALAVVEPKKYTAPVRYETIRMLTTVGRASAADLHYFTGATLQTLRGLEKKGLIRLMQEEELRIPVPEAVEQVPLDPLSDEQEGVFRQLLALTQTERAEAALLHGVTGSGKTQIYLHLVQETLAAGKTAIVLVPEIVLTPQMMRKFASCFGSKVAMLHSSLRMTERCDQWKRIRRGEVQVVLGTRSAIFAPLQNLGLIVLDEEQESSYQSENPPRYHTRDVAKYLCGRDKALLILGSATPSVETAWWAEQGRYQKALLRKRYNDRPLPSVTVADLRQEIRNGNSSLIGEQLRRELEENLRRGEQSILFLNRRGSSRYLLCGECGHVPECSRCSVALTYHSANGRLMCHHCGLSLRAVDRCGECGGIMKHIGDGTQKVEEDLRALFPETDILRMDADTTLDGHENILRRFAEEKIPILLGTQMVAKGLDFPNVTLVGVLSADLSLYVDSYRAAERTFNLLTQVVGRAGRGGREGRAVIQTYTPENEVIRCAVAQDYDAFYAEEIRLRRLHHYPPFADLFVFTVSGGEEGGTLRRAANLRDTLRQLFGEDAEVLGPAPAPVLKVNNRYRYRCTLAGMNDKATREKIGWLLKEFANDRGNRGWNLYVDCNPLD